MIKFFTPLADKACKDKPIWGFDIETHSRKNYFVSGALYDVNNNKPYFFSDKDEMTRFLAKRTFRRSIICATNLSFDFYGLFGRNIKDFKVLFRGSNLISAVTTPTGTRFTYPCGNTMTFLDTMNYAPFLSVEKQGNILGIKKLPHPQSFTRIPKNNAQWKELEAYNIRDAEISGKFLLFLYNGFKELGAIPKITIASTSMDLFRRKYLKDTYFTHGINLLREEFLGYYGGRTEAFGRGTFFNKNYYDINSLYPYAMTFKNYPDVNSVRISNLNSSRYIENYEGFSHAKVFVPDMMYPLLPLRHNNKLIFPSGIFSAYYSHIELRKAMEIGCRILKVYKSIYYKETCAPFKKFINHLFPLRIKYQNDKNPMETIVKLCMNALYGKFGQKFDGKIDLVHKENMTVELFNKARKTEQIGEYYRVITDSFNPPVFTIPAWASYVTANARLELYKYIQEYEPIYCDTDSIMTEKTIPHSSELGKMKLEAEIDKIIIVKPKFYIYESKGKTISRAKGIPIRFSLPDFERLLVSKNISYEKIARFREVLRRNLDINEVIRITKDLNLEDNKREWGSYFRQHDAVISRPLNVDNIECDRLLEFFQKRYLP